MGNGGLSYDNLKGTLKLLQSKVLGVDTRAGKYINIEVQKDQLSIDT